MAEPTIVSTIHIATQHGGSWVSVDIPHHQPVSLYAWSDGLVTWKRERPVGAESEQD